MLARASLDLDERLSRQLDRREENANWALYRCVEAKILVVALEACEPPAHVPYLAYVSELNIDYEAVKATDHDLNSVGPMCRFPSKLCHGDQKVVFGRNCISRHILTNAWLNSRQS